jgi:hypothetical protein
LTETSSSLEPLLRLLTELPGKLLLSAQPRLRCLAHLLTQCLLAGQLLLRGLLNQVAERRACA